MPDLPARFAGLILVFAPLFVHRSWRHARVLLIGAILTPGLPGRDLVLVGDSGVEALLFLDGLRRVGVTAITRLRLDAALYEPAPLRPDGRALVLDPQPADVQDRDGARPVLRLSRRTFPIIAETFADAGYAGNRPATATIIAAKIVRKLPGQVGFAVHPRRWVVERFFAWVSRNRRLWKDSEATLASAKAFLYAAAVMILIRRPARSA